MVVGGGDLGPDSLGQHPSESPLVQRDLFDSQEARKASLLESLFQARQSFGKRNIVKVNRHGCGSIVTGDRHVVRGYEKGITSEVNGGD
jgi:hypothetical protein